MTITGGAVLFAVLWFLVLLVVLPLRLVSQGEAGSVVPGTPSSAPSDARIARKMKIATLVTIVLWCMIASIIVWGGITIRDLDWFGRMAPLPD
ncbi:DUF1467 family protein [Plastorhodobacter daqingensis]|uniref:DUF1467 family protein n=1 Tax=Plastorhodobacter daqingensis TaxID=1387281 RepID=A0ABW2UEQ0_9RHOB